MAEEKDMEAYRAEREEQVLAFGGPAVSVNKFLVAFGKTGVRIALLEEDPTGQSHFRTAVTMHPSDAELLANILQHVLRVESAPQEPESQEAED